MTKLDDGCAALIADPKEGGLHLYIPRDTEDETGMFTFLAACAARAYEDSDWVQSMIDWFELHAAQRPN